jgi:2-dehydro-3-deoxygluconokinase
VAFDPNIRLRLWPDRGQMTAALNRAHALADISLPGFDDEAAAFGDAAPQATAERIAALGAGEVVVKNGPAPALIRWGAGMAQVAPPPVPDARDTTGAGDSFNAGYLAARLRGDAPDQAAACGHALAAEVIRHPGALIPETALTPFRKRMP